MAITPPGRISAGSAAACRGTHPDGPHEPDEAGSRDCVTRCSCSASPIGFLLVSSVAVAPQMLLLPPPPPRAIDGASDATQWMGCGQSLRPIGCAQSIVHSVMLTHKRETRGRTPIRQKSCADKAGVTVDRARASASAQASASKVALWPAVTHCACTSWRTRSCTCSSAGLFLLKLVLQPLSLIAISSVRVCECVCVCVKERGRGREGRGGERN